MKKIVALVLALVMVLGLATTAFGAITLWDDNGETIDCDVFEGNYNTKLNDAAVAVTYDPGQALKLNKDGSVKTVGEIAHYEMYIDVAETTTVDAGVFADAYDSTGKVWFTEANYAGLVTAVDAAVAAAIADFEADYADYLDTGFFAYDYDVVNTVKVKTAYASVDAVEDVEIVVYLYVVEDYFVEVASIPATADASEYFFVKAHDAKVPQLTKMKFGQSATDAYIILKAVDTVNYFGEAVKFADWSDDCEAYAAPANADEVDYYTVTKGVAPLTAGLAAYKLPALEDAVYSTYNVLVDGVIVTLDDDADEWVSATKHVWKASAFDAKTQAPTEYTCVNCNVVGAVINSPINAPAGAKIDRLPNGTLVAYTFPVVEAPVVDAETEKVESAETFDAGIAMYVGMSVMAAAGSAVVLKKKD